MTASTAELLQRYADRTLTVDDRKQLADSRRQLYRRPDRIPPADDAPNHVDALQAIAETVREVLPGFRVRLADGTIRLVSSIEMSALHHYPCPTSASID